MGEKAIRVWREDEKPVEFGVPHPPFRLLTGSWLCPGCGKHKEYDYTKDYEYHLCNCGTRVLVDLRPTLTELEPNA